MVSLWLYQRFRQASNIIYGIPEGRPFWKTFPLRLALPVLAVAVLVACALIVIVSGSIANEVGDTIGVRHAVVVAWDIVKWFVLVSLLLAILYWAAPNVKQAGIRWISPGGVVATILWLVFSALFVIYVTNFGSYNKTYGSLAGIVIFLIWLWLSNIAILLGTKFNAKLDHAKAIEEGLSPEVQHFAEPRDTRKMKEDERASVERSTQSRRNA